MEKLTKFQKILLAIIFPILIGLLFIIGPIYIIQATIGLMGCAAIMALQACLFPPVLLWIIIRKLNQIRCNRKHQ